jgi:RNA polymerase sigma factor (sigma-70 family)
LPEIHDSYIISLIRKNDSKGYGFSLLVQKYREKIYLHIRHILIDHEDTNDVVQDVFISIWKNIGNFREESSLFTWIYRIASNEALLHLRRRRRWLFMPLGDAERKAMESLADDNFFSGDEADRELQKAILTLPGKQRLVFTMKYFGGLKYEEISAITGTSVGALKASFHIAVKKIENYIRAH